MNLQGIYHNLKKDLQVVEAALVQSVQTNHEQLFASASHLLKAGGKRMRPVFVLLSGHFGKYEIEKLRQVAVTLELIHMASLVHDDVIDNARTRRGRKTVKAEWDNRVAMYTGDFIFARALEEITRIKNPDVQQILSTAIMRMCQGEIEQIKDLYNSDQSLRRYLHRIKRKTALLMAVSCQLGALVSGAVPEIVRNLNAYGYYVGMAFQLTDDVLDLTGEEETLGKPAGSDLRQGNVTLPVIYSLAYASPSEREKILAYLHSRGKEGSVEEMIAIVQKTGGVEYTLQLSKRYLQKAINSLECLPFTHERESLRMIAEFIVTRSY
ncbi:polyprenyl synthetase family protein [Paenactinomyces guangxiensis]|uniref:Polyprenyl synthetase family protein n=1 Tax=Paenactinomyces guangxiensis TaxID=1490290 RepID=A0A7W1WT71_9BACL|nr:polyprenyl synthetase family protein [Paenactinomyces guangxiensis]MBA4495600.1 polyprenyl synthetase family protein [Paenactinomyces guangxiensis]MBH8592588.1 polyprenyl synthetase family protein [Paenactinomyces guangxiensis]